MNPEIIFLEETASTNLALAGMVARDRGIEHGTVVAALKQTAGRGQRGNTWESEPGCNVTMSMLLRPEGILAPQQFYLTEIVACAIVDVLDGYIPTGMGHNVSIKWPNDIYIDDSKVCGTLIENSLRGNGIEHSIAGIGLNVNQEVFVSDAPNPVSILNVTGRRHSVDEVVGRLTTSIRDWFNKFDNTYNHAELHALYLSRLWRSDGFYKYRDAFSGELFDAEIADVEPMGFLVLRTRSSELRRYAFKEVSAVLDDF